MNSCFIFLGNTTTLHRFIVQVECSSNRCWQGKCSESIHFSDRVIIQLYKWKLAKGILVDNQRSMQHCCFSFEMISSLCPWNLTAETSVFFWFLCAFVCELDGFPIYAITHQFACCLGHSLLFAASISHLVMFHAGKMHRKKYCERLGWGGNFLFYSK